ncbi:hypothetical protein Hhis01_02970 [Haloarcula hispanica]
MDVTESVPDIPKNRSRSDFLSYSVLVYLRIQALCNYIRLYWLILYTSAVKYIPVSDVFWNQEVWLLSGGETQISQQNG